MGCIMGCGHDKYTAVIRLVAKLMDDAHRPEGLSYSTLALAKDACTEEMKHISTWGPAMFWCWTSKGGFTIATGASKKFNAHNKIVPLQGGPLRLVKPCSEPAYAVLAFNWDKQLLSSTEFRNALRHYGFLPRQIHRATDSETTSEETEEEEHPACSCPPFPAEHQHNTGIVRPEFPSSQAVPRGFAS